jgi:cytochrome c556
VFAWAAPPQTWGSPNDREEFDVLIRTVVTVSAFAVGLTAATAQQDPIAARKALMKGNGQQAALAAKMIKGEEPFDLVKAKAVFATFQDAATKMPALFPDNSKTGGETAADPKIWASMDDFKAKFAKLGADAKNAEASVNDRDSLKAAFGIVGKDCGGCHETYRIKKS